MNGSARLAAWMTLFVSCAIATSVYLVTRYASHLNEIKKSQYEICVKAPPVAAQRKLVKVIQDGSAKTFVYKEERVGSAVIGSRPSENWVRRA
jgi:hypothetical protein